MKKIWNLDYEVICSILGIQIEKRYIKENYKVCEYCEDYIQFEECYEISNSEDNLLFFICKNCLE